MTSTQQSIYNQMKKSIDKMIEVNPSNISFEKYAKKDNGFGTMVIDLNSAPALITEQVLIAHNVPSAQRPKEIPIGLGEIYYNYILFRTCSQLEENSIITEISTGKKYRVHDIDMLDFSGKEYAKRAIVEHVQ